MSNFSASFMTRRALRYPSGPAMPKLRIHVFLGVPALLVSPRRRWTGHRFSPAPRPSPCRPQKPRSPMQLDKILHHPLDIVERMGAVGVAGNEHALPTGQVGVDLLPLPGHFRFQTLDLVGQGIEVLGHRIVFHFLYALLKFVNRFFEFENRSVLFHDMLQAPYRQTATVRCKNSVQQLAETDKGQSIIKNSHRFLSSTQAHPRRPAEKAGLANRRPLLKGQTP